MVLFQNFKDMRIKRFLEQINWQFLNYGLIIAPGCDLKGRNKETDNQLLLKTSNIKKEEKK